MPGFFPALALVLAVPLATAGASLPFLVLGGSPVVLVFDDGIPAGVRDGTPLFGGTVDGAIAPLGAVRVRTLDPERTIAAALVSRGVAEAFLDPPVVFPHASSDAIPNDPLWPGQYGPRSIRAPAAWDVTNGSRAVVLAIIDTGLDVAHPDFQGVSLLPGFDFVENDAVLDDDCGHGTHVTGIAAAARGNGVGIAGVADVTILPLKALDRPPEGGGCVGNLFPIAAALVEASLVADVVSMSWGGPGRFDLGEAALEIAAKRSVLVASAGNSGCDGCVHWPANAAGVIAVGCTTSWNGVCGFSSRGPEVELSAPGWAVVSTTPNARYASWYGTSMSAPHVSASAALVKSANPALPAPLVREILGATAQDFGAPGRDRGYGFGLVDAGAAVAKAVAVVPK